MRQNLLLSVGSERTADEADYPVEFLDVTKVTNVDQLSFEHPDVKDCDLIVLYGAGYPINGIQNFGKDVIIFQRWRSGPV